VVLVVSADTNFRLVDPQRVHCHSAVTCGLIERAIITVLPWAT
jgi:hypothetical protein